MNTNENLPVNIQYNLPLNIKPIPFSVLKDNVPRISINILICVLFASLFIIIFFFTYVKKVEEEILIKNIDFTLDELVDDALPFIPDKNKKSLYNLLNETNIEVDKEADNIVEDANNSLIKKSVYFGIFLSIFIFIVIAIIYLCNKDKINPFIPEIVLENIIIVGSICLVEFLFLNFFISEYISANPNLIKKNLLNILRLD